MQGSHDEAELVAIRTDGGSFLMAGDDDGDSPANESGQVLPRLLREGWRIIDVHMTAAAGVNDDQVLGPVVLESFAG